VIPGDRVRRPGCHTVGTVRTLGANAVVFIDWDDPWLAVEAVYADHLLVVATAACRPISLPPNGTSDGNGNDR
jgi:hypothetical protein